MFLKIFKIILNICLLTFKIINAKQVQFELYISIWKKSGRFSILPRADPFYPLTVPWWVALKLSPLHLVTRIAVHTCISTPTCYVKTKLV